MKSNKINPLLRGLRWLTAIVGLGAVGWGAFSANRELACTGAASLTGIVLLIGWRSYRQGRGNRSRFDSVAAGDRSLKGPGSARSADEASAEPGPAPNTVGELDSLVGNMLADKRFALLLRPQIAGNLSHEMLAAAQEELESRMALVPAGEVQLEPNRLSAAVELDVMDEAFERATIDVAATFLDRYPVTNRQYQAFVASGGYEQMSIWDQAIWPAVLDFVDSTGKPGPRYWVDGHFPPDKDDHPVVGICWYEAAAYARWVGRRLPTDAEWVKAASWPVNIAPGNCVQRKYPWGNAMERPRANLWGSGTGDTVRVDEFASGVSVGGVYQLIGNVWEWTADNFLWVAAPLDEATKQAPLKTIRGGAFDTYFDNQATSQFASGEKPLARKHNIGFRCALGICDLAARVAEPIGEARDECEIEQEELETV